MMKSLLVSAVTLGVLTSTATAEEPNQLTSYSAASHSGSSLAALAGCPVIAGVGRAMGFEVFVRSGKRKEWQNF